MEGQPDAVTLLEAARTVARGGQLDAKLDALAEDVRLAAGAQAALIYLLDPLHSVLLPGAQAGLSEAALSAEEAVALDDPHELVARVVRERRAARGRAEASRSISRHADKLSALVCLPLVVADEVGGEDAEGALLAGFTGAEPDPNHPENPLTALADLCAVAIRTARLEHALTERAEWLERLATTDTLTGLANRTTLVNMLELEIARANREKTPLSVVVFDVDGLTEINERAGANVGDDVLRLVASTIADQVRVVDTVGRVGRDEFALVAPGNGATLVGRRVQEAAARIEVAGERVTLSAGAAVLTDKMRSGEELLEAASAALEEAKRRGSGKLVESEES